VGREEVYKTTAALKREKAEIDTMEGKRLFCASTLSLLTVEVKQLQPLSLVFCGERRAFACA
jgi:hypothetical protein